MSSSHEMPFGAELREEGVRFRLWAPGAQGVELQIEGSDSAIPMTGLGDGWFGVVTEQAEIGARYLYRIDANFLVPDPASRFQPEDVHGPSAVMYPGEYVWRNNTWRGRPWEETTIYELHVGTFTPKGSFEGVMERLGYLSDLGVTAIELMPSADFPGTRNWGYDGVLPFAPASCYGTPNDLKRLVDFAHDHGLMVFLDVVYNHFGPEGNYLNVYAPQFFTGRFETSWGAAIDFGRREVRDFFVHNALYWLEEFRFDGLRLDAVHAIFDESTPNILEELAENVRKQFRDKRYIHLILENHENAAHYLERDAEGHPHLYTAQWNDDIHHACHVIATGERSGYYQDFADVPLMHLVRCLAEGFSYQGQPSGFAGGRARGEPSGGLPPTAFISFLQNHDQVGNRAFGERLSCLASPEALHALRAVLLLAPSPPLLFMGEEWAASEPFLFFCDFHDELADKVREGRRREFERFPEFSDPSARARIPDPNAEETFARSSLDWSRLNDPVHAEWLARCRELLALRRREIVPRLAGMGGHAATTRQFGKGGLQVSWTLGDGAQLTLMANLSEESTNLPTPAGRVIYTTQNAAGGTPVVQGSIPDWCATWFLSP